MTDGVTPVGYGALLRRNRSFRRLFAAMAVSWFGDWFNTLAVLALLRELGHLSAGSFGGILILKLLPTLLLSAPAGVAADRLSRRRILMAADLARGVLVLLMLALSAVGSPSLLYVLVGLQAAAGCFFEPARQALLPDICAPQELTAANAITAATWSAMLTLGTAAGGLVTAGFGWEVALLVDALSYGVSALFLLGIAATPLPERRPGPRSWRRLTGLADLVEGLEYLARRPRILSLVLVKTAWGIGGALLLVLTVLGERRYDLGGHAILGVSLLYVARGVGTGVGPILGRWLCGSREDRMEQAIGLGVLCGVVGYGLLGWVDRPWLAAWLVLGAHIGGSIVWVFSTIRLQQLVPSAVRGRVFATDQALFTLTYVLSVLAYGWLIDDARLPLRWVPTLLGGLWLLPAAAWALRGAWLGWAGEPARAEGALREPAGA